MRASSAWRAAFGTLLLCFATLLPSPASAADDVPTLEEVIQTLRARQEKCRTAHVKCDVVRQGTLIDDEHPPGQPPARKTYTVPKHECEVHLAGEKVRFEKMLGPPLELYIEGFDGKRQWSFEPAARNNRGKGHLRDAHQFEEIGVITTNALMNYLRPLHPLIADVRPETYVVQPGRVTMEGRPCIELSEKAGVRGSSRMRIWLDLERDLVVVRSTGEVKGRISSMVNVEYQNDPQFGWVPSSWKATIFGKDRLPYQYVEGQTTKFELNCEVDDGLFSPNFPEGVRVTLEDRNRTKETDLYSLGGGELRPYEPTDD